MTDKVIENLNRILSLPAIYVRADSKVLKYIGFVENNVNPAYIPIVPYFRSEKGIRRFCYGNSGSIIYGLGKNIRHDLSVGYDLIPFSNTKEPIRVTDYMLYTPQSISKCHPFDNPYDFVEDVLMKNGYEKDFRLLCC